MGFGLEQNVCGLSGGDEKYVGVKGFDVDRIDLDHCDGVVCDAEEELIVHRLIDQPEKESLIRLHLQFECICRN